MSEHTIVHIHHILIIQSSYPVTPYILRLTQYILRLIHTLHILRLVHTPHISYSESYVYIDRSVS